VKNEKSLKKKMLFEGLNKKKLAGLFVLGFIA
jgi:hypothetical protein